MELVSKFKEILCDFQAHCKRLYTQSHAGLVASSLQLLKVSFKYISTRFTVLKDTKYLAFHATEYRVKNITVFPQ